MGKKRPSQSSLVFTTGVICSSLYATTKYLGLGVCSRSSVGVSIYREDRIQPRPKPEQSLAVTLVRVLPSWTLLNQSPEGG